MPLDPELKSKWVAALRSGKYKQGKYRLRKKDETYCCLGVLCDITDPTKWTGRGPDESYGYNNPSMIGIPPFDVIENIKVTITAEMVEMMNNSPHYRWKSENIDYLIGLDKLNDSCELTFEQIANIVEKDQTI